jgi:hypothetical protein
MWKFIILFLIFSSGSLMAQENIIKVYSAKAGRDTSHKVIYPELKNVIKLTSLPPSIYKFYIKVDDACKISMLADRSPKLTDQEAAAFNEYISKYKIEYYENDVVNSDCAKLKTLFFPIKITFK